MDGVVGPTTGGGGGTPNSGGIPYEGTAVGTTAGDPVGVAFGAIAGAYVGPASSSLG